MVYVLNTRNNLPVTFGWPRLAGEDLLRDVLIQILIINSNRQLWWDRRTIMAGRIVRWGQDIIKFLFSSNTMIESDRPLLSESLQVRPVFSKSWLTACTYRSDLHLNRLAYATAPFGPLVFQQLFMNVSCVSVHARCFTWHKPAAYTFSFFEIRRWPCSPVGVALDSPRSFV